MVQEQDVQSRIFPHPGSRIQESKKHRIPDLDPQHWLAFKFVESCVESVCRYCAKKVRIILATKDIRLKDFSIL